MKTSSVIVFLAVVVAVVVAAPKRGEKFPEAPFFKQCFNDCKMTKLEGKRIRNWIFTDEEADKCFMECSWNAAGYTNTDGSFDVDGVVARFTQAGFMAPLETYEFKDAGTVVEKKFEVYLRWVKNRKEIENTFFSDF